MWGRADIGMFSKNIDKDKISKNLSSSAKNQEGAFRFPHDSEVEVVFEKEELRKQTFSPDVSIVVATRNRAKELIECVASLLKQDYENFEIIIIDDASDINHVKTFMNYVLSLSPISKCIKYYRLKTHRGLSYCRNVGVLIARGKIIAFIDDDAIADRSWLSSLLNMFHDDKVAGVNGRIIPKTTKLRRYRYSSYDQGEQVKEIPFIFQGGNCAFRKDLLLQIGLFDSKITFGHEERELSFRLKQMGFKFLYNPDAVIYHDPPTNFLRVLKKGFKLGFSEAYIARKHSLGNVIIRCHSFKSIVFDLYLLFLILLSPIMFFVSLILKNISLFYQLLLLITLPSLIVIIYIRMFKRMMAFSFFLSALAEKIGNIYGSLVSLKMIKKER